MNKSEMLKKLKFRYARYGVQKQDVENIFNGVLELIVETLASGENIAFMGIGTFAVEERAERKGRNPLTGKEIRIPARRVVKFTPGKTLRDAVNWSKR